jgi:hypothetical protein
MILVRSPLPYQSPNRRLTDMEPSCSVRSPMSWDAVHGQPESGRSAVDSAPDHKFFESLWCADLRRRLACCRLSSQSDRLRPGVGRPGLARQRPPLTPGQRCRRRRLDLGEALFGSVSTQSTLMPRAGILGSAPAFSDPAGMALSLNAADADAPGAVSQ